MAENKIEIEEFYGEGVTQIYIKKPEDFTEGNHLIVESIVFEFSSKRIKFTPIIDSDEIEVSLSITNLDELDSYDTQDMFSEYIGKTLGYTWQCINSNGFRDMYIIGLENLHPSIIILSEGSSLKLFTTNSITGANL
ncbi:MAG: DUF6334 family protein [Bacteroidia bacterium]